jgi:hypothetical protein
LVLCVLSKFRNCDLCTDYFFKKLFMLASYAGDQFCPLLPTECSKKHCFSRICARKQRRLVCIGTK